MTTFNDLLNSTSYKDLVSKFQQIDSTATAENIDTKIAEYINTHRNEVMANPEVYKKFCANLDKWTENKNNLAYQMIFGKPDMLEKVTSHLSIAETLALRQVRDSKALHGVINERVQKELENTPLILISGVNTLDDAIAFAKKYNLTSLNFNGFKIKDADLQKIKTELPLQYVKELVFDENEITNEGLALLNNLPNLETLNLSSSENLTSLSALTNLPQLKTLTLDNSMPLTDIKSLSSLKTLQIVNLVNCMIIPEEDVISLASLPQLKALNVLGVRTLTDNFAKALKKCPELTKLDISHAELLTGKAFEHIAQIPKLKWLDLRNIPCTKDDIKGLIPKIPNIEVLHLSGDLDVDDLIDLPRLTHLKSLSLSGSSSSCLQKVGLLNSLQHLSLMFCNDLNADDIKHLENLKLKGICFAVCNNFTGAGLEHLAKTDLKLANLAYCNNLESSHIANLTNLETLFLHGCTKIKDADLAHLQEFKNLETLSLPDSITGEGLEHLKNTKLSYLQFEGQDSELSRIDTLKDFSSLEVLMLGYCPKLTLADLEILKDLKKLQVVRCTGNSNITEEVLKQLLPKLKNPEVFIHMLQEASIRED